MSRTYGIRGLRAVSALAAVAAVAAVATGSALAAPGSSMNGAWCDPVFSQPFTGFADAMTYFQAPGGDFENPLLWSVSGKGSAAEQNPLFGDGKRSLQLERGASATSPLMCIVGGDQGELQPFFAYFARSAGGSAVRLTVTYFTDAGRVVTSKTSQFSVDAAWDHYRQAMLMGTNLAQLQGATTMQISVTAVGGAVAIDDFYVDPRVGG